MLSEATIQLVKATAPVVAQHAEAITRVFYQNMFAGNPEVRVYFNQAHQHSGGQQRALAGAICAYAANIDNLGALGPAVELIAQKHCSLGIRAEHYPIVGKHLLVAIKQVLGDAATDEIIAAWGEAYQFLAQIFIGREQQIYDEQAAAPGGWNGYRRVVVERKVRENDLISSFYLKCADGKPLADFVAGQYLTLKVEHPATPTSPRNYSLSDRPGTGHYRISVKRESGATPQTPGGLISNYLHDHVKEGDVLQIGPPCGEFILDPAKLGNRPLVLLSGGIGITPVLAMLKSAVHAGVKSPIHFIHAARNSQVHAMREEVTAIAAAAPNVRVHFCYDNPTHDDVAKSRCDSTGFVTRELLDKLSVAADAEYYFCGPKPFMVGVYKALKARGVDASRIHFEFFGPKAELETA